MRILLPVRAVKRRYLQRQDSFGLQAVSIDADASWVGARYIERFNAAMPAEIVLRNVGVECVSLQVIFAGNETKSLLWHHQVQVARLAANAAITLVCLNISRRVDFETHTTTVTPAFMCCHH